MSSRSTGTRRRLRQARGAGDDPRLTLIEGRFGELDLLAETYLPVDAVVLDIGVSSMQLDQAERGFSFQQDGPLDMRMAGAGPNAADLVNRAEESALADILYDFGEDRAARRIARAIVRAREAAPITRTRPAGRDRRLGAAAAAARARFTRRRGPFRRCASPSTTSSASWPAGWPRPSACWRPAAGWPS